MKIEINQEYYKCDYCETTHEDFSSMYKLEGYDLEWLFEHEIKYN